MEDGIPIVFISLSMGPSSREVGFASPVSAPGWPRLPNPITPVPIVFIAVPLPVQCEVGLRVLGRSIRPIWRRLDAVMSDGELEMGNLWHGFLGDFLRCVSVLLQGTRLRNRVPHCPFSISLSLFRPISFPPFLLCLCARKISRFTEHYTDSMLPRESWKSRSPNFFRVLLKRTVRDRNIPSFMAIGAPASTPADLLGHKIYNTTELVCPGW
jgi:hypothetical protein